MYPAILVLHRSRGIDGKLRLDSGDSREHRSFKPSKSFQVSQLKLPIKSSGDLRMLFQDR